MEMNFKDRGFLSTWHLNMVTFDREDNLWCVGTSNNIGKWNSRTFGLVDKKEYNQSWESKMIAFDKSNAMWCVGTKGNLAKWNTTTGAWEEPEIKKPWDLKMIAFDNFGVMWCVGADGNVGKWNPIDSKWDNQGDLGGWKLDWIAFRPGDPRNDIYCVGTEHNLGLHDPKFPNDTFHIASNFECKSLYFHEIFGYCIGTEGNMGVSI